MTVDKTLEQFVDRIPTNDHLQFRGLKGAFKACMQGAQKRNLNDLKYIYLIKINDGKTDLVFSL